MSSEVKHTPLPWKISRYGIGFEIEGVVDGEPHVIAQTQQLRGTDRDEGHWERKANTEFIVTAVNNYATLERQLSDLRAALEGKWISVAASLPKRDASAFDGIFSDTVMLFDRAHNYWLGFYSYGGKWGADEVEEGWCLHQGLEDDTRVEDAGPDLYKITHWQPLPPAPKEA